MMSARMRAELIASSSRLNLQSEYDIRVADRELRAKLSPRIRVFQPAVA